MTHPVASHAPAPDPPDAVAAANRALDEVRELRAQLNRRVVPIGSIVAFAGESPPDGWAICQGQWLDSTDAKYQPLFQTIQFAWGRNGNQFRLPDLRGMFLRGVNGAANVDPDVNGRITLGPDPSKKNAVGSTQGQSTSLPQAEWSVSGGAHGHGGLVLQSDGHQTVHDGDFSPGEPRLDHGYGISGGEHSHKISGGDRETRPVNVYVHYIIKVLDI